jgi:hypothetical protein
MKRCLLTGLFLALACRVASAQDLSAVQSQAPGPPADTKFLLTGYTFSTFRADKDQSTFGTYALSEMVLYRIAKNLLIEGEVEFSVADGEMEISLELANINYFVNNYLTLRAGKFSSPLGTFAQRLHPAWINRCPSFALGFEGNKGWGPEMETGAMAVGAIPLGDAKMNYAFFVSNGPGLVLDPAVAGTLDYENTVDNNRNKAVGGRIGILPIPNSSLELGVSGEVATVGGETDPEYQSVGAKLASFDLSFVQPVDLVAGVIDVKGQLNLIDVDKATYTDLESPTGYSFDNRSSAWYAQIAYRPSMMRGKILRNFELVCRSGAFSLPKGARWEDKQSQIDIGLNYWLGWRTVVKIAYERTKDAENVNKAVLVQAATGF